MEQTVVEGNRQGDPGRLGWQPRWTVDVGHGCELGVTVDDGCFVVLYPTDADQWRPGTHIPIAAARRISELCTEV